MSKPFIRYVVDGWQLRYPYEPRSFVVFGMNKEERLAYTRAYCWRTEYFGDWVLALNRLSQLYRARMIAKL